ncbi:MAG: porin [Holosporaceae bacterium]|jgi:predicted porin|nr:porin [Holosporaceae bacterium]
MSYRSTLFLLFFVGTGAFAATRDFEGVGLEDEGLLLGELITNKLAESKTNIDLYFGGQLHLTTLFINQDEKNGKDDVVTSLQGDVELRCLKKHDGYGYGFEMKAKANSGIIKTGYPIMRVAFLFLETDKIGTLKFGYVNTVGDVFSICGDKFLVGYLGAGSANLRAFYNHSAGSIVDTGFTYDDSKAAKIVWLSPVISGFSAGLSFTLDSRDANLFKSYHNKNYFIHEKANFPGLSSSYSRNIISGGVAYEFGSPDDLNMKISVAGWFGKGEPAVDGIANANAKVHNICAYNVGAALVYKKFKISCGYTDNGKSLMSKSYASQAVGEFDATANYQLADPSVGVMPGADSGKLYSAGVGYSLGKLAISAGYFKSVVKFSSHEKSKADIVTLAAEYKFDKLLRLYVEYDHISTDACARARIYGKACGLSSTGKNRANVFMVGSKINF